MLQRVLLGGAVRTVTAVGWRHRNVATATSEDASDKAAIQTGAWWKLNCNISPEGQTMNEVEIRSLVTTDRLRDLLRRNGFPTAGNKDQITYRIASLAIAWRTGRITPHLRARSLINHCLNCVRTWRQETKEAVADHRGTPRAPHTI